MWGRFSKPRDLISGGCPLRKAAAEVLEWDWPTCFPSLPCVVLSKLPNFYKHQFAHLWARRSEHFPLDVSLSSFWSVRMCLLFPAAAQKEFISESVENDNDMLIFTQRNTLHRAISVMLSTGKGFRRTLWFEFFFPPIKEIWVREKVTWWKENVSLPCWGDLLCTIPESFWKWEWWVEIV